MRLGVNISEERADTTRKHTCVCRLLVLFIAAKNVSNKRCRVFHIAGRDDEAVRTVIHNLPVVAHEPSPIRSMLPSDFNLFGPLKKHLAGKRFATDADVKQAVTSWLSILNTYFFYTGIQALVSLWDRRLNVDDEYVESWCISYATYAINISE